MERLALTVADCFAVRGVGLLVAPGVGDVSPPVRIGDALRLVRPDGTELKVTLQRLDFLHAPNPVPNPFLILPDLLPADVPPGTEIWAAALE